MGMEDDVKRLLEHAPEKLNDVIEFAMTKAPSGSYADEKNKKYPLDTEAHVRAAWSYINMPKNASKYPLNGVTISVVKAKIKDKAKKMGIQISE